MKIETITVYKCSCCGAVYENFEECKKHEDWHFDINLIPSNRQFYGIGHRQPREVILDGYCIDNGKVITRKFIYGYKGVVKDD